MLTSGTLELSYGQPTAGRAVAAFQKFISGLQDPHVSLRPDDIVRSALNDENLYFIRRSQSTIIGTTGAYTHGVPRARFCELGSTLIAPPYRGFGLQRTIYKYIITKCYLDEPDRPLIAIVSNDAPDSYTSIERCGFSQRRQPSPELMTAKRNYDWAKVICGEKRLYELTARGLVESLQFVVENGDRVSLKNKVAKKELVLSIAFKFLQRPYVRESLNQAIERVQAVQMIGQHVK
jgi:hypothetical protein